MIQIDWDPWAQRAHIYPTAIIFYQIIFPAEFDFCQIDILSSVLPCVSTILQARCHTKLQLTQSRGETYQPWRYLQYASRSTAKLHLRAFSIASSLYTGTTAISSYWIRNPRFSGALQLSYRLLLLVHAHSQVGRLLLLSMDPQQRFITDFNDLSQRRQKWGSSINAGSTIKVLIRVV